MNLREEEYNREWLNLGECLLAVKIPIATNSTSKNKTNSGNPGKFQTHFLLNLVKLFM